MDETPISSVLTSEGKTRKDADGSYARWCMITGETGKDQTSGIIFMSHPAKPVTSRADEGMA